MGFEGLRHGERADEMDIAVRCPRWELSGSPDYHDNLQVFLKEPADLDEETKVAVLLVLLKPLADSLSKPKSIESQSTPILDVPPELWALIASFSSRQTVARLCLLSRSFYAIFLPTLYSNILEPPLYAKQSSALLKTLRQEPSSSSTLHHPASLIRKLSVKDDGSKLKSAKFKAQSTVQAFDNLRFLPLSNQRGPSVLRVLHWGMAAGIDELERILGSPGNFPHLRELVVTSSRPNHNVNFIQIPGLEVLGCNLTCGGYEALQMLPFSSPHLHTFQLKIRFEYYREAFPEEAYLDLIATVNLIRLPHLRSLHLSITCDPDDDCFHLDMPPANLSNLLAVHPTIVDLSFDGCGLAPITKTIAQSLTKLHSFTGSFEHSCIISVENSNVQRVVLIFREDLENDQSLLVEATPPTRLRSVAQVTIRAVNEYGDLKYPEHLKSQFYSRLASSFPNITHLDIVLSQQLKHLRECITSLANLEYLRVQEYHIQFARNKTAAIEAFPATSYILQLNLFLPALLRLDQVVICILADFEKTNDTDDERDLEDRATWDWVFGPPEMKVVYHFSVVRYSSMSFVSLTNTEVSDPYVTT
ncbi:hypothetical protein C8J57DRAFT_1714128 [Mycena rebaudengoi]|nr:hypothetical protein C8J57DRAFT_1714128 [Mycena rebaudengoi]